MFASHYYSQGDEERYILEAVGSQVGRFLDIGAYHPRIGSNTRALYERGWSGVMIEPAPVPFQSLLEEYGEDPRITLVNVAVSELSDWTRFHASPDMYTTSVEKNYQKWKDRAVIKGSFFVKTVSIADLLHRFDRTHAFSFVSIDTEGTSVDLFREMLSWGGRPQCYCIEHDDRLPELAELIADAGYHELYRNENNVVISL